MLTAAVIAINIAERFSTHMTDPDNLRRMQRKAPGQNTDAEPTGNQPTGESLGLNNGHPLSRRIGPQMQAEFTAPLANREDVKQLPAGEDPAVGKRQAEQDETVQICIFGQSASAADGNDGE